MRSRVWRANGVPSRSRRRAWTAPTLSRSTGSRWTLSGSRARASPGYRKWLKRIRVWIRDPGQLEREEGVSTRCLVDAKQGLARERCAEPVAQESVDGPDAERFHRQPLDSFGFESAFEHR